MDMDHNGMSSMIGDIGEPELGYYPPGDNNDHSGGLPISLDSLRDGPPGSKPFYPYSTLIRCVHGLRTLLV